MVLGHDQLLIRSGHAASLLAQPPSGRVGYTGKSMIAEGTPNFVERQLSAIHDLA
jgi:hypothetical protein